MLVPQKEFPTEEEIKNMDDEERQQFIFDYYNGAFAKAGYKPTFKEKMKYRLGSLYKLAIGLIAIVIVFAVINLAVVGTQKLWHHGDQKKYDQLKVELDNDIKEIQALESKVKNNTISDKQYNEYTNKVDSYNVKVEEINELAEKIGTTYYVVPMPGKGSSK